MSAGAKQPSKKTIHTSSSTSKLAQDVIASLNLDKEWPDNVIVYSLLKEQELLPDIAREFVVKALLAVNGLKDNYKAEKRHNAGYMAPKKGMLPFLRIGNRVVGQEEVLDFLHSKSFVLKNDLSTEDDMVMQGVISLVETKLSPIELYSVWIDPANKKQTRDRYGYNLPEPLRSILCWQKSNEVKRYLKAIGLLEKSEEQLKEEISSIYQCIAKKLEDSSYIIGEEVTEADVYVYGHLQAILESKLENNILMKALEDYPKLTNFCLNFNLLHLGNKAMIWEFL